MTNIIETDNMKKYRISGFRAFQKWDLTSYNASFRHADQSLLTNFFRPGGPAQERRSSTVPVQKLKFVVSCIANVINVLAMTKRQCP